MLQYYEKGDGEILDAPELSSFKIYLWFVERRRHLANHLKLAPHIWVHSQVINFVIQISLETSTHFTLPPHYKRGERGVKSNPGRFRAMLSKGANEEKYLLEKLLMASRWGHDVIFFLLFRSSHMSWGSMFFGGYVYHSRTSRSRLLQYYDFS